MMYISYRRKRDSLSNVLEFIRGNLSIKFVFVGNNQQSSNNNKRPNKRINKINKDKAQIRNNIHESR